MEIWDERPHRSEISGLHLFPIGHFKWHWQFAHVLSKGAYPAFKFRKENIMLITPDEHENQEKYPEFIEKREALKKQYYDEQKYY